jgi:hypothetical protein
MEDNQWGACRLEPKNSRREFFQRFFLLGICRHSIDCYFILQTIVIQPGFVHGHKSRQEIIWIARKYRSAVCHRSGISAPNSRRGSTSQNRARVTPCFSFVDTDNSAVSSKSSYWMWSINCGEGTVLSYPGPGTKRGIIISFKLGYGWKWHTLVQFTLMILSKYRENPSLPWLAGKTVMLIGVSMFF